MLTAVGRNNKGRNIVLLNCRTDIKQENQLSEFNS